MFRSNKRHFFTTLASIYQGRSLKLNLQKTSQKVGDVTPTLTSSYTTCKSVGKNGNHYGCKRTKISLNNSIGNQHLQILRTLYSQVPNTHPPCLLIFLFFPIPDHIRTPPFVNGEENEVLINSSIHFFFVARTIQFRFQGKMTCFCMYFGFLLHENFFATL